jgi:hypothetical protein
LLREWVRSCIAGTRGLVFHCRPGQRIKANGFAKVLNLSAKVSRIEKSATGSA